MIRLLINRFECSGTSRNENHRIISNGFNNEKS